MVRKDPLSVPIDRRIVERDYQLDCIDTLTREFQQGRRKMLVEMATGTGKTRTAAAFMKRLLEANAITRVLFLVDRDPLDAIIQELLHSDTPILVVLAGSKGAGKTTFYRRVLGDLLPFVNADEIGRALDPEAPQADPYAAARLADLVRRDLIAHRRSFCMETVFSDPAGEKLQFLRTAQLAGYRVVFVWIRIDSVELSMARVQQRVDAGGHDVPDEKLVTRFDRTARNAREALTFVDLGLVLDNSEVDRPFRHLETWRSGQRI